MRSWRQKKHDLAVLFGMVSAGTQKRVKEGFEELIGKDSRYRDIERRIAEATETPFRLDLIYLLRKNSDAFERWRYLHEGRGITTFAGFIEIQRALRQEIVRAKPSIVRWPADRG